MRDDLCLAFLERPHRQLPAQPSNNELTNHLADKTPVQDGLRER
jgi:hypothetical protein